MSQFFFFTQSLDNFFLLKFPAKWDKDDHEKKKCLSPTFFFFTHLSSLQEEGKIFALIFHQVGEKEESMTTP